MLKSLQQYRLPHYPRRHQNSPYTSRLFFGGHGAGAWVPNLDSLHVMGDDQVGAFPWEANASVVTFSTVSNLE